MKNYLFYLLCVVALLCAMTSCDGIDISFGSGDNTETPGNTPGTGDDNGDDNGDNTGGGEVVSVELAACWHLKSFCGMPAEVDIYIDFTKYGKFTIYQRTEELEYTVFKGTYTVDEEKSLLSGLYSDGTSWSSNYLYTVDVDAKELTLESVTNPSEVAIYEISEVPAVGVDETRSASVNDVKPL